MQPASNGLLVPLRKDSAMNGKNIIVCAFASISLAGGQQKDGTKYETDCLHLVGYEGDLEIRANVQGDAMNGMLPERAFEALRNHRKATDAENAKLRTAWDEAKKTDPKAAEPQWLSPRVDLGGKVITLPEGWTRGPVKANWTGKRLAKVAWWNAPSETGESREAVPTLDDLIAAGV